MIQGSDSSIKSKVNKLIGMMKTYKFLFEELVKRDFNRKYKRTVLGMFWSVLSPLLTLLVMRVVFTKFFGRSMEHFTIYLFSGNLVFSYFKEATTNGMISLMRNASIISKVKLPKYIFVLSDNVTSLLNFALTLTVFFIFVALDKVPFSVSFFSLIYPILCLLMFNIGVSLILSALYVFFRDTQYLYNVATLILMYLSAIFYPITSYSPTVQRMFLLNPVYVYIKYFRVAVLEGTVPSLSFHGLCLFYAVLAIVAGAFIYKKNNDTFLYYM